MWVRELGLLEGRRGRLARLGLAILVAAPLANFHPLVWRFMVDVVLLGGRPELLLSSVLVMLSVHLAGSALSQWCGLEGRALVEEAGAALRGRVHRRLLAQGAGFHQAHPSGDLLARGMGDVEAVVGSYFGVLTGAANTVILLVWVAGVLLWLHPTLALVSFLPLLVALPLTRSFHAWATPRYLAHRTRLGEVSHALQEDLQGLAVTQAFGRQEDRAERQDRVLAAAAEAGVAATRVQLVFTWLLASLGFITNALIAGGGVLLILHGQLTLGTLVAFRGYWATLYGQVQGLGNLFDQVQRGLAAGRRVHELLEAPLAVPAPARPVAPACIHGRLSFEAVELAYSPGQPVLAGVSLEVSPGEHLGLVGPSGAGKSSLLGLVLRYRDPDQGRVLLDGIDLRELDPAVLRRAVAPVPQDPFLFSGTVADNLRVGCPGADERELWEALEQARAREFVEAMEGGLGAMVGERGATLSGGQRQRLCIARAFLADPAVLLLDEATSSVEPEAEASIREALHRLMRGRTAVIVTHRLAMLREAPRIVVLEGGRIREQGNHQELMRGGGWYARMEGPGGRGEASGETS